MTTTTATTTTLAQERFELLLYLGEGSYGSVYLAVDHNDGMQVVTLTTSTKLCVCTASPTPSRPPPTPTNVPAQHSIFARSHTSACAGGG
jgi:serine/threonine protein kinase